MADFVLSVEDQATQYYETDQKAGQLFLVLLDPSDDFEGELTLEKFDKLAYAADPSGYTAGTEVIGTPPPARLAVMLPDNWKWRLILTTAAAGSIAVGVVSRNPGLSSSPSVFSPEADRSAAEADNAAYAAGIAAVVTDLEGDVAGNSVAQAITDLEALP